MSKETIKPIWFKESLYKKNLTHEDWLIEINKRVELDEKLANPLLDKASQEELFDSIILKNKGHNILEALKSKTPEVFKPLSLAEILVMAAQIMSSDWYRRLVDKDLLEKAIITLNTLGRSALSNEQKVILEIAKDIPWYEFLGKEPETKWLPESYYGNGVPVSFNIGICRDDVITEIKKLLHSYQKPKTRNLTKKILSTWEEKKILQLFDLDAWFKIQQIQIPKMKISTLLWPESLPSKKNQDEMANSLDLLNEAQKLRKKAISKSTLNTLFSTCENIKARRPLR
jgi:hypothetical protein